MQQQLTARLADVIFHNESNAYTVAIFETETEQFCGVGVLPAPKPGFEYVLEGEWGSHPKYGEQFAFLSCTVKEPGTCEGIYSLLSSGLIKGVGPATARLIVKRFGKETLDIIENHPEKLTQVSGIGQKKADAINECYVSQKAYADTLVKLSIYDLSPAVAYKLYQLHGAAAPDYIQENPFSLTEDLKGVGFKKADEIARKAGFAPDSPHRISSGILYTMENFAADGNSYMPKQKLLDATANILGLERALISENIPELVLKGRLCLENIAGEECVYLRRFHRAELLVATKIYQLCNGELGTLAVDAEKVIKICEKESGNKLSTQQKQAVLSCLHNGVSVITGGPGTGKTTVIKTLLHLFDAAGLKTALAAPTGRAAKRMEEATGRPACTVHRLLGYNYEEEGDELRFTKNQESPLEQDCIIVDEFSMADILLAEGLLKAVKPGTRLVLVGDADQLPPVGAGNVLKDILACEYISQVCLTEIFRQAAESMIIVNAHAINKGEYPSLNSKGKDFFFVAAQSEEGIKNTIVDLCCRRLPLYLQKELGMSDTRGAIQVLTPVRKGQLGCMELNKALQNALNPAGEDKPEKAFGERIYRKGDKVMHNRNDYELSWHSMSDLQTGQGVFNGDLGTISNVDTQNGKVSVLFDGARLVTYDYASLDELETAYAMTVHKSQGCEFPVVVMPIWRFPPMLATRNLLYTAITRAKSLVVLVGNPNICNAMVDNNAIMERNSALTYRLNKIWAFQM